MEASPFSIQASIYNSNRECRSEPPKQESQSQITFFKRAGQPETNKDNEQQIYLQVRTAKKQTNTMKNTCFYISEPPTTKTYNEKQTFLRIITAKSKTNTMKTHVSIDQNHQKQGQTMINQYFRFS